MPRVSFLSHDMITKSPNDYPPYLYGGIRNLLPGYPPYPQRQRVTDSTSQTNSHSRSAMSSQHGNLPIPRGSTLWADSVRPPPLPPREHMILYDHRLLLLFRACLLVALIVWWQCSPFDRASGRRH